MGKSFFTSTVTKAVLGLLLAQVLVELAPMLKQHQIDWWRLGEVLCLHAGALIMNALRSDVNAPGFNWFGPGK